MRWCLFCVFIVLVISKNYSQERCGTTETSSEKFEEWIAERMRNQQLSQTHRRGSSEVFCRIPIVFHLLDNEENELDEAKIIEQVRILNEDFRRHNPDTINTPDEFKSVAADIEIEFFLAQKDPFGNRTNGIIRYNDFNGSVNLLNQSERFRFKNFWPPTDYLNIIVGDFLLYLGYSSFPFTDLVDGLENISRDYILDAVHLDVDFLGINPNNFSRGRTLTHEIGHYFGLRHIWGDGNCTQDDFVQDTPLADSDNESLTTCIFPSSDDNLCVGTTAEMFQNYMDYTHDECMNLFTKGQKERILTVLENSPRRVELLASTALEISLFENDIALQRGKKMPFSVCQSILSPSVKIINNGTNVVNDYTIELLVNDILNQTFTNTTPLDTFGLAAWEAEDIVVDNEDRIMFRVTSVNGGTDGNSLNNKIESLIKTNSQRQLDYEERFTESNHSMYGNFGNVSSGWEVQNVFKNDDLNNQAIVFREFKNKLSPSSDTWLVTPSFNTDCSQDIFLKFSYAYAPKQGELYDGLVISTLSGCSSNESLNDVSLLFGEDLATSEAFEGEIFRPQNDLEWGEMSIQLNEYIVSGSTQIVFQGVGGASPIYIDDISVFARGGGTSFVSHNLVDPFIVCQKKSNFEYTIINQTQDTIKSLALTFNVNDNEEIRQINDLNISTCEQFTTETNLNLDDGKNELQVSIKEINGVNVSNSIAPQLVTLFYDTAKAEIPYVNNFSDESLWFSSSNNSLWEIENVEGNDVLTAQGYENVSRTKPSYLISPVFQSSTNLNFSFDFSYAKRDDLKDQLKLIIFSACDQNKNVHTLFDISLDTLATQESNVAWAPHSSLYDNYKIEIQSLFTINEFRFAFVFDSEGGQNLYIDNIVIAYANEDVEDKKTDVYPNPTSGRFFVELNLSTPLDVSVRLVNITGAIIETRNLYQTKSTYLTFDEIYKSGIYFIQVVGNDFSETNKVIIR